MVTLSVTTLDRSLARCMEPRAARPARARIRYLDPENEIREIEAEGLLATCLQHEIDHLNGVLFVTHLSMLKRNIILRKLAKVKRLQATA